jgi:hypothetical protein
VFDFNEEIYDSENASSDERIDGREGIECDVFFFKIAF